MTTYATSDESVLESHPRASAATVVSQCGGGIRQPGHLEPCPRTGTWEITFRSGGWHYHAYCTRHALVRLRAADLIAAAAREARGERQR